MPSGTPRTHGGHGRPPPPAPRIGPRVRRGGAGQPADPGLDQAGPGGRGRPRYRPRPPAHRRAPTAGTRPRIGPDQAAVNHRGPAARRVGPRRNAAPTGRPEPDDQRAAARTARKAPERSEPAIRPLLLRSRRHTRRGEQRPVCAGRAVGYPGLTAARLLVSSGSAGRGGHECLDHGCESGWVVTSEARMPSGSATSSSPTGGGHCSALYAHADVSAALLGRS